MRLSPPFVLALSVVMAFGSMQVVAKTSPDQPRSFSKKENRTHPDFQRPLLKTAIARADNDITTTEDRTGRKVALPRAVSNKIHELAIKEYRQKVDWIRKHEDPPWFPKLKEVYGPVFRVDAPRDRKLYIFKTQHELGLTSCYYLLFYDPHTTKLSQEPPCIIGRWSDLMQGEQAEKEGSALMQRPYVFFDDLNQDQEPEIVIQEQVHNGSLYNGVVYHYFFIGADLSLKEILALEARLIDILSEKESGLIIRIVEKLGPNRIKILVRTEGSIGAKRSTPVGEILLEAPDADSPFAIKSKIAFVEKYEGLLVTGSEDD